MEGQEGADAEDVALQHPDPEENRGGGSQQGNPADPGQRVVHVAIVRIMSGSMTAVGAVRGVTTVPPL
jgi:hypothetical protein